MDGPPRSRPPSLPSALVTGSAGAAAPLRSEPRPLVAPLLQAALLEPPAHRADGRDRDQGGAHGGRRTDQGRPEPGLGGGGGPGHLAALAVRPDGDRGAGRAPGRRPYLTRVRGAVGGRPAGRGPHVVGPAVPPVVARRARCPLGQLRLGPAPLRAFPG